MKFHGDVDFASAESALGQIKQPGIGLETSFPESPIVGRIVFVSEQVWICVALSTGIPVWVPMTNKRDTHVHTQSSTSATWAIAHNLNTVNPIVQIYDDTTQKLIIPDDVAIVDNNNVTATFSISLTGRAIVMYGDPTIGVVEGALVLQPDQVTFTHTQSVGSTAWVVTHNLGYYPITRVFLSTDVEIQPLSIVHDSIFQTTISFSSAQTGRAKFV